MYFLKMFGHAFSGFTAVFDRPPTKSRRLFLTTFRVFLFVVFIMLCPLSVSGGACWILGWCGAAVSSPLLCVRTVVRPVPVVQAGRAPLSVRTRLVSSSASSGPSCSEPAVALDVQQRHMRRVASCSRALLSPCLRGSSRRPRPVHPLSACALRSQRFAAQRSAAHAPPHSRCSQQQTETGAGRGQTRRVGSEPYPWRTNLTRAC